MSIISCASGSSCWRGLDYYKMKKVSNIKKISDDEYTSIVSGSDKYTVYVNLIHPRQSTCNCPLANGKRIVCKHIVATYFSVVAGSAKKFEKEQERLEREYENYRERQYKNAIKYLHTMTKDELIKELTFIFNCAPEWIYDEFIRDHNIEG